MGKGWSDKYKKSINCDNPKGFSQRAHCQGKKKKMNEEGLRDWFGKSKSKDGKSGWVNVVTGGTCASDKPGEGTPKCVSSAKRASMTKAERLSAQRRKKKADPGQQQKTGAAKPTYVKTDSPRKMKKEEGEVTEAEKKLPLVKMTNKANDLEKDGSPKAMKRHKRIVNTMYGDAVLRMTRKEEMEVNEAKDKKGKGSGTKDACYHKVKSRYSVWPSAYASGALVKCRKVGAANWGNSTKKEGFTPSQIAALESVGAVELNEKGQKCWKGYEKKGTKMMFGKRYNNCVKKEEVDGQNLGDQDNSHVTEATTVPRKNGQTLSVIFTFRGKYMSMRVFFPELRVPAKAEVQDAIVKIYPGARVTSYSVVPFDPSEPFMQLPEEVEESPIVEGDDGSSVKKQQQMVQRKQLVLDRQKLLLRKKAMQQGSQSADVVTSESAAWTRKAGKNKEGGLNEKGRKSYERENPGSDLKAPSKKVGNPRRASFCARMKGMKKKLTSKKTASDPNSRINKSLRAWNC